MCLVLVTGYRNLNTVIEEGICQVLGHMWLESQTYAPVDATEAVASSSSASSTHTSAATHRRKVHALILRRNWWIFARIR